MLAEAAFFGHLLSTMAFYLRTIFVSACHVFLSICEASIVCCECVHVDIWLLSRSADAIWVCDCCRHANFEVGIKWNFWGASRCFLSKLSLRWTHLKPLGRWKL